MACNGMRFTASIIIAAILASTAAAPAVAQDAGLFGYFKTICAPGTDPDAGAARAQAQGFAPAKKKSKVPGLNEVRGYEKTIDGREFFVFVGRGAGKPKDGLPASTFNACGVGLKCKDEAALAAGRKWVGVPASRSIMGVAVHGFRQAGGGRTALSFDDKPAMKAALMAGDFNGLTVSTLGGVSVLMLSKAKPAS